MFSPTRRFAEVSVYSRLDIGDRKSPVIPLTQYQNDVDGLYSFSTGLDSNASQCMKNLPAIATHLPDNTIFDLIMSRPSSIPDFKSLPIEPKVENKTIQPVSIVDETLVLTPRTKPRSSALTAVNNYLNSPTTNTSPNSNTTPNTSQNDVVLADWLERKLNKSSVSLADVNNSSLDLLIPTSRRAFTRQTVSDPNVYYSALDSRYNINSQNVTANDPLTIGTLMSRLIQILLDEGLGMDDFSTTTLISMEREINEK